MEKRWSLQKVVLGKLDIFMYNQKHYLDTPSILILEVDTEIWLPRWLSGKEFACNAGDLYSIPGPRRSPEEGNGNRIQYSCLENPIDRGAWWAKVHGITGVRHDLTTKPPPPNTIHKNKL